MVEKTNNLTRTDTTQKELLVNRGFGAFYITNLLSARYSLKTYHDDGNLSNEPTTKNEVFLDTRHACVWGWSPT
jgi:hypothetical protein